MELFFQVCGFFNDSTSNFSKDIFEVRPKFDHKIIRKIFDGIEHTIKYTSLREFLIVGLARSPRCTYVSCSPSGGGTKLAAAFMIGSASKDSRYCFTNCIEDKWNWRLAKASLASARPINEVKVNQTRQVWLKS